MSKLYLIGNSHIDPVWLWRWQDGFAEILATFRSALDRMKDFPNFKYTSACASYYQFIEKADPEMFAEIKQRVKEGRWNIVGGWFLQADCNIPDGESFARHALISQRYFKEKFDLTVKTGYNVDSFGHNASLPKILRESGMENYVFTRPSIFEQGYDKYLFNWQSNDGSSVTAYRIPGTYGCKTIEIALDVKNSIDNEKNDMMLFYGVGNHGGGPTIALIEEIKNQIPNGILSTPDEYFDSVDKNDLPTYNGELQHHARGCYSSLSYVKKSNRICEQNLVAAEKLSLMAYKLTDYSYPTKKYQKAWKNLLFNQFHDILCGCCIKSAYDDASYLFGETMSITEQELYLAMQKIALNIDTLGNHELPTAISKNKKTWEHEVLGIPVIVFNPHTFEVNALVSANESASKVCDEKGNEIPFQIIRGEQTNKIDKYRTAFIAKLPPLGYTTYKLYTEKASTLSPTEALKITENSIENNKIKIEFDAQSGDICSFFNKELKINLIDRPCRAVLLDETDCDTWAHDKVSLGETVGEFSSAKLEIIEKGPIRAVIRSTSSYGNSTIVRDFCVLADDDRVTVKTKINFHEKHKTLKFTFPMKNDSVTAKIPYGIIERPAYTGEEPCGSFIASGNLAVANDSKYGYDTENGEMRLSILRGAIYADHYGERDNYCEFMDQGISEFTYALFAHTSASSSEKLASELNFAPRIIMGSFHHGDLPETMSCFETNDKDLIVSAIKKSEDDSSAVIRCFDLEGNGIDTEVKLFDSNIKINVKPNGIGSFKDDGTPVNFLEYEK